MTDDEIEHTHVDAWIFIAIAGASTEFASPLSNLIATADFYNHAIPSAKDVEHGVRDLSSAGLIRVDGPSFSLTTRGHAVWTEIARKPMVHERFERARRALRDISCVAEAPGWSLDQRVWEDAFAGYSSQFALELKRRRKKT